MPVTYTYKWQRTPDGGATIIDIPGATGTFTGSPPTTITESYALQLADEGDEVRLEVTDGIDTWHTLWSAVIGAAPTPGGGGASSIYWGSYVEGLNTYGAGRQNAPWDSTTWNLFESHTGKTVGIMHFGQPLWQFNQSPHDLCWTRGAAPFVDYGASNPQSLIDVANGVHDTEITAWATAYKNWGKPVFIRLWWEMNQYGSHWFPWAVPYYLTAAQYKAGYEHVWNIINTVGATNMTGVWCPNFITNDSSKVTGITSCYPSVGVDWLFFDGYNDSAPSRDFDTLYQLTYNTLVGLDGTKPIGIGEFASRDNIFASGVKANWITEALTNKIPSNAYDHIKAVVWFNYKIYENSVWKDWQIESSASAQAAFHDAIASSYYKPKFGATPPFGKVPIPT